MKKTLIALSFAFIAFIFYTLCSHFRVNEQLELKTVDLRLRFSNKGIQPGSDIAVILVDEASLQSMKNLVGRWPWPRSLWGDLVDFLAYGNAKMILFDLIFSEPQDPGSIKGRLGPDDQYFADICSASSNVIHAVQLLNDTEDEYNKDLLNRELPEEFAAKFALKTVTVGEGYLFPEADNYYLPLKELYKNALGIGVVEFLRDNEYGEFLDSTYRRTHLIRKYHDSYLPTLSFAAVDKFMNLNEIVLEQNRLILNNDITVPLLDDGTYLINMKNNFTSYSIGGIFASMQKIRRGETDNLIVNPSDFSGKIVLVGTSAAGIEDLKNTSLGENIPGVFLHAAIISNFLNRDFIYFVPRWITSLMVLLVSLVTAFLITRSSSYVLHNTVVALLAVIFVILSYYLFDKHRLLIDFVNPVFSVLFCYIGSYIYLSSTEGREKRRTKKMLCQYVSPAVLTEVVKSKNKTLTAGVGSKVELTILFSDIRGFTTFSETANPEQVVEMLNYYLEHMVNIVFKHEGTLDKFIGDAVMAFWGAPIITTNHALSGVLAAIDMRNTLKDINAYFSDKGYPAFQIGIGLHTGEVILGNIGSEKKLDYTVIGDNVNLSSRIEGLTKTYGSDILITEKTYEQIKDSIVCRPMDLVKVKGKNRPIKIYQPLASLSNTDADITDRAGLISGLAESAFTLYLNREWDQAINEYLKLSNELDNDLTCEMFIQRCKDYKDDLPEEDWDGSFTMKSK